MDEIKFLSSAWGKNDTIKLPIFGVAGLLSTNETAWSSYFSSYDMVYKINGDFLSYYIFNPVSEARLGGGAFLSFRDFSYILSSYC